MMNFCGDNDDIEVESENAKNAKSGTDSDPVIPLDREQARWALIKRNWLILFVLTILGILTVIQVIISMYTDVFVVESVSEVLKVLGEMNANLRDLVLR